MRVKFIAKQSTKAVTFCDSVRSTEAAMIFYKIYLQRENKNSSGDEIANVNFLKTTSYLYRQRLRHWTDFLISTTNIYARPNLCT